MDYQKIILLGSIAAPAKVKQAKSGTPYAEFSVTVDMGKGEPSLFPVILFGQSAKAAGQVLSKGARVLVEGGLDVDRKTSKFKVLSGTFRKV